MHFTAAGPESTSNIPFVMLSRDFADKLLAEAGEPSLAELEKQIDEDLKPRSHELKDWTLSGRIAIERTSIKTKNVVGVLEGAGPHADETVVIGGHYDHLGRGGLTVRAHWPSSPATSTTVPTTTPRAPPWSWSWRGDWRARRDPLPRRVVFMAFSGEERGLLGSQYYVEHPLFPLESTVMMFNCDMVGRLNAKNELTMIGTGTSPGIDALVDVLGKSAGLTIKKVAGHDRRLRRQRPPVVLRQGRPRPVRLHGRPRDYHRPSDDSDRINYAGMARIADYLELILLDVIRRPERPAFIKMVQQPRRPRAGGRNHQGERGSRPKRFVGHDGNHARL